MKIHIIEKGTFVGVLYELTIDASIASFVGAEFYKDRFPSKIDLRDDSQQQLKDVVQLLGVFEWQGKYLTPTTDDGVSWSLEVECPDRIVRCYGENGYPSYKAHETTSGFEERFGLLRSAIFSALKLSVPYGWKPERSE
ncbi:hypothetical protein N9B94_03370 [Verrucomicrobia bacterium]|nr:hypothetical protein [Verrucomicrobiota bacterium]